MKRLECSGCGERFYTWGFNVAVQRPTVSFFPVSVRVLTALVVPSVSVSLWCRSNETVCKEKHNKKSSSSVSIKEENNDNNNNNNRHKHSISNSLRQTLVAHCETLIMDPVRVDPGLRAGDDVCRFNFHQEGGGRGVGG